MKIAMRVFWLVMVWACVGQGCTAAPHIPTELSVVTPGPAEPTPVSWEPKRGGILVISSGIGTPRHFNSALISGSATAIIATQIFASPLRYDANWNPQPYLAKSWDVSEDGLRVTLHLVEGATFHDGVAITSEDVAFSVMIVKTYHPFSTMFAPVEAVETPDPYTAVIRLARPHPSILLAMSPPLLPILPKHIYGDGQDILTHPANLEPVGSGPFRFVSYTQNKEIRLERYEQFFIPERPYLDGIMFRLEPDPVRQVIDIQRGEVQMLTSFTELASLERLGNTPDLVITQQGYGGLGAMNWLAFNLLHKPLDDKSVRQAIAYAVDPDFIIEYLHKGLSQRANSPIFPSSPFYDPVLPAYTVDLDKANKLLDQAGYPVQADGKRFSLTLDYLPVLPSQQEDVAIYLIRQLARIGINIEIQRSASFSAWAERIGNWDFDLTMDVVYNWGDPAIGVHRTYLCDNIRQGVVWSNTQNYCNPEVDALLAQAEREMDPSKRKALYFEFQQIVTEELPVFWINTIPIYTVYDRRLGNPPLTIWGVHNPMDEVFWNEPHTIPDAPLPVVDEETSDLKRKSIEAMALLQAQGLYASLEILDDPTQGFLDLESSGLHIIGFTRQGIIILDNSGQIKPGIDISSVIDLEGNKLIALLTAAADGANGGLVLTRGVWPHPQTNAVDPVTFWCGKLNANDIVCAMTWVGTE